jgi:cysteine-rich repeat protein
MRVRAYSGRSKQSVVASVAACALIAACGGRDSLNGGLAGEISPPVGGSAGVTASGAAPGVGGMGGTGGTGGTNGGTGGTLAAGGMGFGGDFSGAGFNQSGGNSGFGNAGAPFAGAGFGAAGANTSGGFGNAGGTSFGGASGFGNAGFSPGGASAAGSAGSSGAAGSGGSGGSVGTLGDPCAVNGALACHGPAQRLRLLCDAGFWQTNGTCSESENCDQRTGVCAPIVTACKDREPASRICTGDELRECGPDLVTTSSLMVCEGRCVESSVSAECAPPACGDGKLHEGEGCDDGDTDDTDACTNACTPALCGDGSIYAGREVCDDGNLLPRDGCSVVCGSDAVAIALGYSHSCALGSTGNLQCWGYGSMGQLGLGDANARGSSEAGMGPGLPTVSLGTGKTAVAIAAAADVTCAILNDGGVKCWGANHAGGLGVGDVASRGNAMNHMGDNLPAVPLGSGRSALRVALGRSHTCALLDDHSVKCWGHNGYGQLGQGDKESRGDVTGELGDALPPIALGTGRSALAIAAGAHHTCAVLDNQTLKCWGYGYYGQLGVGSSVDRGDAADHMGDALPAADVGAGRYVKAVAAGDYHTCALLDDNSIKCFGYNGYGQLGYGDTLSRGDGNGPIGDALPSVALGSGRTAKALAAGVYSTCAILDDDSIKCWGTNSYGGLGVGDSATRGDAVNEMGDFLPRVSLGAGRTAKTVAAGSGHTCALLDNDAVKCWGANSWYQLGLGASSSDHRGDAAGEMGDDLPFVRATF